MSIFRVVSFITFLFPYFLSAQGKNQSEAEIDGAGAADTAKVCFGSATNSGQESPPRASDLFGGPEALAGRILEKLLATDYFPDGRPEGTPLEIVGTISRQDLLDHFFDHGISMDQVMDTKSIPPDDRERWREIMRKTNQRTQ